MTDRDQAPTMSPELRVKLAVSGENLRRWYRLRRLSNQLQAADDDAAAAQAELRDVLEATFCRAVDEAEAHAALLEANAETLDALLAVDSKFCGAPEDVHRYLGKPGSDNTLGLANRLRALSTQRAAGIDAPGEGPAEGSVLFALEKSAYCTIASVVFGDAYFDCQDGVPGGCAHALEVLTDLLVYCPSSGPTLRPT